MKLMVRDEMILYKKAWDPGSCSFMASMFLFTFIIIALVSFFSEEKEALSISLYVSAVLTFILVTVRVVGYWAKREENTVLLTVCEEGIHYHEHTTLIQWKVIADIQIVNRELSVSVGATPALDFTLNLLDTDLQETFDDFCQLLNRYYYPKTVYIYESSVSCGC
ncbi:hypothetical protein [Pedobacter sp. Bi27]|uniref:hypothetical protein n=1 Tax=Pedobacter sp. Bi27 TaxID=2822351 RepID=UPI001E5E071A|nr:hypothetical protein [Pedobacter sp. Bi27]